MFRMTDIRNIAIEIEKNGEASYRQAARTVSDPSLSELLAWMADEEQRHRQWFENFTSEAEVPPEHAELEQMGKSLLQDMMANQTFSLDQHELNRTGTLSSMLAQSKAFEDDTILFYEFLQSLLDDEQTARELDIIITEERRHAARLEELVEAYA
jgi:rubrerythrin